MPASTQHGWIPWVSYNWQMLSLTTFICFFQTATLCHHWQLKQLLPHPSYWVVLEIYFWLGLFPKPILDMSTQTCILMQWHDVREKHRQTMANTASELRCAGGISAPHLRAKGAQTHLFPGAHHSHWHASCTTIIKTADHYETSTTAITKPRNVSGFFCCSLWVHRN